MTKTLNVRYLVRLTILLVVVGITLYFLHRRQAGKQAILFLEQAKKAEEEGNYSKMIDYYERYLHLRPSDLETRKKLGIVLPKYSRTPEAKMNTLYFCEQIVREDPEDEPIRREVIRLSMDPSLQRFAIARTHIEYLLSKQKTDGDLEDLLGRCDASERKYPQAIKHWNLAIQYRPDLVQTYARLAYLLRKELKDTNQADAQIEQMVQANPNQIHAHLIRLNYWRENGNDSKVKESLQKALQLGPGDAEVLLNASLLELERAETSRRRNQLEQAKSHREQARQYLRLGIEKNDPPQVLNTDSIQTQEETRTKRAVVSELYRNLVDQELRGGQMKEAEEWVRQALGKFPEQVELTHSFIDILIRQSKFDEANDQLKKFETFKNLQVFVDYHQARIAIAKAQWLDGMKALQRVLNSPDILSYAGLARQAYFLLGECYERIDDREGRLEAYQRAIPADPFDPLWGSATIGKARSLADLGRRTEAISVYRNAIDAMPSALPALIRLLIGEVLSQPKERQDWKPIEELVSHLPDNLDRVLMQNDIHLLKGEIESATKLLQQAKVKYPQEVELAVALAFQSLVQKNTAKAEELLNEAEKQFGDKVSIRLGRSRLISADSGPEGAKRLAQLATNYKEAFHVDERKILLNGLLDRAKVLGEKELVGKFLDQLIAEDPNRLSLLFDRFDQAIQANERSTIQSVLKKIQELTGEKSASGRFAQATYLIWEAKQESEPSNSKLRQAETILANLERERPNWSRIPLALGVAYDLLQNLDRATTKYQQAIDLGERNPEVLQRLAELYYTRNQRDQVEAVLNLLPDQEFNREGLRFIAADVALESGQLERALILARKQVTENTQDYTKQLWLAHVLFRTGNIAETETVIRRAIDLAKNRMEPRLALIEYLLRMEKKSQAETELENAKKEIKKEEISHLFAKSSELMNKLDDAAEWYKKALAERPDEIALLRDAASFFLSKDIRRAEYLCKQIIDHQSKSESDKQFAERILTVIVSLELDPEKVKELLKVMKILDSSALNDTLTKLPVSEIRKQALARTAQRGRQAREDALRLYRELETRGRLEESDRSMMAQLYYRLGKRPEAETQLSFLISAKPKNFQYVLASLQLSFDEKNIPVARKRFEQLKQIDPSSLRVAEWNARLLLHEGKEQQSIQVLQKYLKEKPESLLLIAAIFENMGILSEAEKLLLQFAKDPKQPEGGLLLANFYAKYNRKADALHWLTNEDKKYPPKALVNSALNVLYTLDTVEKSEIGRVWTLLINASKGTDLTLEHAAILNLTQDYSAAIKLYRTILPQDPRYPLALNNLTFLLAYHEKNPDEALNLIERASQGRVPDPTLLDTKALVLLAKNKPKEAIPILEDSIVDDPTKSTTYYHLARAYFLVNDKTKAQAAWERAKKRNLRPSDLHRLELEEYEKLKRELR